MSFSYILYNNITYFFIFSISFSFFLCSSVSDFYSTTLSSHVPTPSTTTLLFCCALVVIDMYFAILYSKTCTRAVVCVQTKDAFTYAHIAVASNTSLLRPGLLKPSYHLPSTAPSVPGPEGIILLFENIWRTQFFIFLALKTTKLLCFRCNSRICLSRKKRQK